MPRKETTRKRAPAGMCVPYLKTKIKNGKEYTYYEVKCTTGYDPLTGKQKQRTISGKTQKEVVQKYKAMQAEVEKGIYLEPCKLTLAEWLEIWQNEYLKSIKPNTVSSYKTNCRVHIIPALGKVKLSKLTPLMIQQFYNNLRNASTGEPLSPKTIKNIHGTLHRALSRAFALKYIAANPADAVGIDLPKVQQKEITPMEDEDIKRFVVHISSHKYRIIYLITLFTGLREGEVLGLTWNCINWDQHTITVKQQLLKNRESRVFYLGTPKNGRSRTLYVANTVLSLLQEQREKQNLLAENNAVFQNEWDLVFTNEMGDHLSPVTVYNHFKRLVKAIGCDGQRFHDLRHSYATSSIQAGDDIKTVQGNLGHYTAAFTLQQYGHVKTSMAKESAARMEEYIQSVLPASVKAG